MGYTLTNHSSHTKGSAKHNDRTYAGADLDKAKDNLYYQIHKGMTFEENERTEYERLFRPYLDAHNQKQIDQRHPERCKTMEDLYESNRTRPEEIIHEVGNSTASIDPETLKKAFDEYLAWHQKEWPGIVILDSALHLDEKTPHFHTRQVWTYKDEKDGLLKIGQEKYLQQKGIGLPDETKARGQHNNRKQVYTARCREKLIEIYKGLGVEIEKAASRTKHEQNLDKEEFVDLKYRKYNQAIKEQEATIERQKAQIDQLTGKTTELKEEALERAKKNLLGRPKKTIKVPAEEYDLLIKRAALSEDLKTQEQAVEKQKNRNIEESIRLANRHDELDRRFEEQKKGATAEDRRLRDFMKGIEFSDGMNALEKFEESERKRKIEQSKKKDHSHHR